MFKNLSIVTIGGVTEDITFYTKEGILINNQKNLLRQKLLAFEYGAKIKIDKAYSTFGGGAANTAVNFAGLGFNTTCLSVIGNDERGRRILNNLKKHKVNIKLIQKTTKAETGFSLLLIGPNNEYIIFSNRAANDQLRIADYQSSTATPEATDQLQIIQKADVIYLTSLSGNWKDVLEKIFYIKKPQTKIAWNPGNIQLKSGIKKLQKFLKQTDILLINKDEALELIVSDIGYRNKNFNYLNNTKNLLKILKSFGPRIILITNSKYGAAAYDGQTFYYQKVIKEKKHIDTTGVGDAFNSSFVAGLELYKGNIQKAMYLGAKNAASVISEQGAQNGLLKFSHSASSCNA